MTEPSNTPRTNAVLDEMLAGDGIPKCMEWTRLEQHARTLERDLAAARHVRKIAEEQSLERAKRLDAIRKAVGAEDGETTEAAVERQIRCISDANAKAERAEDLVRRCIRAEEVLGRLDDTADAYGEALSTVAKIHSEMQRMCPEAPK